MGDHEGQRDRRAVHISAADVEQPGHAVERRNHRGIEALGGEPFGHLAALGFARLAGELGRMDQRRGSGRCGAVSPDGVDRIGFDRDHARALVGQRLHAGIDPGLAVQPRVEPDLRTGRGVFGQPGRDRLGRNRAVFEQPRIDLIAHLDRVAAIDEDRCAIGQDNGRAGRTAEPGQPGQPLGIAADIFAHVLVGDRDNEAIQAAGFQFLAQGFQSGFVGVHQHGLQSFCGHHRAKG